jgi:hypothetical protein
MNRLIVILSLAVLLLAFQNCAQPMSLDGGSECQDCGPIKPIAKATPIITNNLQLFVGPVDFRGESEESFSHWVDVDTEILYQRGSRGGCSVEKNPNWRRIKTLLSERGLCNYSYEVPADAVRCMAYALPFALARHADGPDLPLTNGVCEQSHTTICGRENFDAFAEDLERLSQDLRAEAACLN